MMTDEVITETQKYPERKNVVLFGIEAHICVLQTSLDLLDAGYNVFLVADGISSMNQLDRTAGLKVGEWNNLETGVEWGYYYHFLVSYIWDLEGQAAS